jgi:hypothetical protein
MDAMQVEEEQRRRGCGARDQLVGANRPRPLNVDQLSVLAFPQ